MMTDETPKELVKVNNWRRRNTRLYANATSYIYYNYKQLLSTLYKYNVSIEEQISCQCDVPLYVAHHLSELYKK